MGRYREAVLENDRSNGCCASMDVEAVEDHAGRAAGLVDDLYPWHELVQRGYSG